VIINDEFERTRIVSLAVYNNAIAVEGDKNQDISVTIGLRAKFRTQALQITKQQY
jgi:hypothetical protein